jgi:hypothetical protein
MLCSQCNGTLHGTPWVSLRRGVYAFLCAPACKEAYENETHRIAWTQRSLDLGWRAVNGA